MSTGESWGVNRHTVQCANHVSVVLLVSGWEIWKQRSALVCALDVLTHSRALQINTYLLAYLLCRCGSAKDFVNSYYKLQEFYSTSWVSARAHYRICWSTRDSLAVYKVGHSQIVHHARACWRFHHEDYTHTTCHINNATAEPLQTVVSLLLYARYSSWNSTSKYFKRICNRN